MFNVIETRKLLEQSLGEELTKKYFTLMREYCSFKNNRTKYEFDIEARKLLKTEEQIHNHNRFVFALYETSTNPRNTTDKGTFELAELIDYIQASKIFPSDIENRSAASELFQPDSAFINARIAIHTWENGLEGAESNVTDVLVQACQLYVKNIISAMITRKEGYKVRDGFQYGIGLPVPDPFIRNTNNIIDTMQESKVEVNNNGPLIRNNTNTMSRKEIKNELNNGYNDRFHFNSGTLGISILDHYGHNAQNLNNYDTSQEAKSDIGDNGDGFMPTVKRSLDVIEQQTAFNYACSKRKRFDGKLTVKLLYDTLMENPNVVGLHSVNSINLLKVGLELDNNL